MQVKINSHMLTSAKLEIRIEGDKNGLQKQAYYSLVLFPPRLFSIKVGFLLEGFDEAKVIDRRALAIYLSGLTGVISWKS